MALVGCSPVDCLTVQGPDGKSIHIFPKMPLLFEQHGNINGPVPTYAKYVFASGIVPHWSVSGRVFPKESVAHNFSRIRPETLERAMATGTLYGMALPIGVRVAWGAWLEETQAAEAKKKAAKETKSQDWWQQGGGWWEQGGGWWQRGVDGGSTAADGSSAAGDGLTTPPARIRS